MAFTSRMTMARQEQVWDAVKDSWNNEAFQIRQMLTERTVARLGQARVAEAEQIASEGWKWITVDIDFPYGYNDHLRQLDGTPVDVTVEEQATIEALTAEHDKLEEEYADADELPDEVDARLGEIETALLALEDRPVKFDRPKSPARACFVSIARDGTLRVDRGYVPRGRSAVRHRTSQRRRTSARRTRRGRTRIIGSSTGRHNHWRQAETEEEEDDAIKPLPDRLVSELTAYRTLTLRMQSQAIRMWR